MLCSGRSSIRPTRSGSANSCLSICRAFPYTLSHRLNPSIREFRRASSTAIDASLKPLMAAYMRNLEERLQRRGLQRPVASRNLTGRRDRRARRGGSADPDRQLRAVHGAGRGALLLPARRAQPTIIVADTGGTTYDVSLVRKGRIPISRDTWIGPPYSGRHDRVSLGRRDAALAPVAARLRRSMPVASCMWDRSSAGAVPGPVAYRPGRRRADGD